MACNKNRGEIVDLEAHRATRAHKALEDANKGMLQAEEALFQLLRGADRLERRRQHETAEAAKPRSLSETQELPAIGTEEMGPEPSPPAAARVLPFPVRRVSAA